jgi:cell wall-associated NlpC family hydrolase
VASLSIGGNGLATPQDIALSRLSALLAQGDQPPSFLVGIYKAAARRYDVPWTILAAINAVETDYGRDSAISTAGAEGWMQFLPSTWAKYAVTQSGRRPDPYDPRDAVFTAARYLRASGAPHHLRRAIFAYNHAAWYVDEVMWLSERIAAQEHTSRSERAKLTLMLSTAKLLNGLPYVYGGGHSGWTFTNGYDCSGFVSAILHAAGYLTEPVTTQTLPGQARIESGPGKWVTIFDRTDAGSLTEDHVIIEIDGQWWESGGSATSGGGASVHRIRTISASYLATFNLILHPRSL